ncbi:MAG: hypothetical protein H6817_04905 [Phycisphaerales bacterium]|nr:hypothetical protein [Phycisphaerales bacterium]
MAKAKVTDQEDESVDVAEAEKEKPAASTPSSAASPAPGAAPSPAPRRAPGQKEVIPFEWKVCGYSPDGHTLTLFKSVEKADSEAQLTRLTNEGYYEGLKLYAVDDPVPESPKAKKLRQDAKKKGKKGGDDDKADEPTSVLRKSAKSPSVVSTPMGKMVDGRLTIRRKKSAEGKVLEKPSSKSSKKSAKAAAAKAKKEKPKAAAKSATKKTAVKKTKTATKKTKTKTATKKTSSKTTSKKTATKTAKKPAARKRKK